MPKGQIFLEKMKIRLVQRIIGFHLDFLVRTITDKEQILKLKEIL